MRQGEILNLKWADVNFNTNLIKVTQSKSGSPRYIPMNSGLVNMLKLNPSISEYVFGSVEGKAGWTLYRKSFEKAVEEAEIIDFVFTIRAIVLPQI